MPLPSFKNGLMRLASVFLLLPLLLLSTAPKAVEPGPVPVLMLLKLIETSDLDWLKQMADKGYPIAELSLARAYRLGKGVERDPAKQIFWTQKAASQDFVWAQYEMGRIHESGEGTAANLEEALVWYRKAGEQEHIPALRRLADLKDGADAGEGWRAKLTRTEEQERRYQALQRDVQANKMSQEAAYEALATLAQEGFAKALADQGGRLVDGRGVERDTVLGIKLLREAESKGIHGAMFTLGMVHAQGRGVERDLAQAVAFFRRSLLGNFVPAFTRLAAMTEAGEGVPQDLDEAVLLYRMAAEQGERVAQRRLGEFAEAGFGMQKNSDIALQWYKRAAQSGDAKAKEALTRLGKPEAASAPAATAPAAPSVPTTLKIKALALAVDSTCHGLSEDERGLIETSLKTEALKQNLPFEPMLAEASAAAAQKPCDATTAKAMRNGLALAIRPRYQEFVDKDAEGKLWAALLPARLVNRRCGFFGAESAGALDRFANALEERIQERAKGDTALSAAITIVEEEFANQANKSTCDGAARQKVEQMLKVANNAAKKGGKEF
ncbi:MAG: SEL1-like repeat protein [Alphaproteobacteria bacterium]|nr:SEL1-like repeat protein [Alphaproteobacteria bacterium]